VRLTSNEPRCPRCGEVLDAATSLEGDSVPTVGDVSVCAYCSALLMFIDPLPTQRLLSDAELRELDQDVRDDLMKALVLTRAFQRLGETGP
jgi:hypothetical protein